MKVFLSLAERSASNYVYHVFKDIKGMDFHGITDERLESIGFKSVRRIDEFSVVGIWEALPKIPKVLSFYREMESVAGEFDAFILCDAPALNLPLLKRIRKKVKKVIYFISPQVWAWREGRAKLIAELVDHLIVILPFEVESYRSYGREGFKVHFVGHPLVDLAKPSVSEAEFKGMVGFEDYIAVLPGSRWSEIRNHSSYVRRVYERLYDDLRIPAVIPTFEGFRAFLEEVFKGLPVRVITQEDIQSPSYNAMAYARVSLVASGTADLEASLLGSPHLSYYRVNPLTYHIGKLLIKVPYITLTNLILGKEVVPELIQRPPEELYLKAKELLSSEEKRTTMREEFERLKRALRGEGALQRLRELFIRILSENSAHS